MELREINTFIAVVQNKNFSHAAQKLGYTQGCSYPGRLKIWKKNLESGCLTDWENLSVLL